MIIAGVVWFSNPKGSYGIVFGKDRYTGVPKMYIGPAVKGDADLDMKYIAEWGARINPTVIKRLHDYFQQGAK